MSDPHPFSPGEYGDLSGVTFHGHPPDGWWTDHLEISDFHIGPLFNAALARAWRSGTAPARVLSESNELTGWREIGAGRVPLSPADASALASALAAISPEDLAEQSVPAPVDRYLECAALIAEFLSTRVARGIQTYIQGA
jgi:hypothetical protein